MDKNELKEILNLPLRQGGSGAIYDSRDNLLFKMASFYAYEYDLKEFLIQAITEKCEREFRE